MDFTFSSSALPTSGTLVATAKADAVLSKSAQVFDKLTNGAVAKAVEAEGFTGKKGEVLEILAPAGMDAHRLVLVGVGKVEELLLTDIENMGGALYKRLSPKHPEAVAVTLDGLAVAGQSADVATAHLAAGMILRSYRFDTYKTKKDDDRKPSIGSVALHVSDIKEAEAAFLRLQAVAEGVFLTRQLVSEPPNKLYPETFADEARKLEELGVKVTVLGEKKLKELGMGALLAVGMGSERESKVAIMEWQGAKDRKEAPVALVGKGVTFDTGGISLKPAAGMEDMKFDMGGAGVVFGAMKALAGRKAKANVVGICGLVENMPAGNAQRPSDIVTSYSGKTVEVLNTDAEGRLVLADILSYVQEKHKPRAIVDLATLTGAMIIALGHDYAGIFSNSDELSEGLTQAGKTVDEKVWRLPLDDCYDSLLNSEAADMKNIGGRPAGSITAAQFLQRFIENDTPWVHIDIAGTAWAGKESATAAKGATGYGVRLLDQLVADRYES
ncbi:leucyl aminopeptidase [Kiloniella sp. b19]|uniref:leucyl aminopeptidase n=1 Tax=Kiloniella sp. GXU_MW_B19 TaxID=3141326 RepID=UPI0031D8CEA6